MVNTKDNKGSNILLIGFMATGKTTMAKEISKKLAMEYIDLDKVIEEKIEMSIADIFERYGEEYFRQVEKQCIKNINQLQDTIISCGGGVCLDPDNIVNIKKAGKVILLEGSPETILSRIKMDRNRPLLKDKDDIEGIKRMMDERKYSYHQSADIIIDTSGKSVLNVRDEILRAINE